MFISNGLTSPKWSPAWPTPRLKLSRVQVHRVTIFSIWLKMGLCADTGYVQSVSFSIIYFTSVLLKSGVIFFGITLISDGVLSWVSWLNLFIENIDVAVCASLPWGLAARPVINFHWPIVHSGFHNIKYYVFWTGCFCTPARSLNSPRWVITRVLPGTDRGTFVMIVGALGTWTIYTQGQLLLWSSLIITRVVLGHK